MTNERLADLAAAGVSIWLDDLSRERLQSGNLQSLITHSISSSVSGRGTSTCRSTYNFSPQNQASFKTYCTGSC